MSENYYDFAYNDYEFVKKTHENNYVFNSMCSIAQKVCVRFLKHIIDQYYVPENEQEAAYVNDVMSTQSLRKLERFLVEKMDIQLAQDVHSALNEVNGFYYETSYPGDESFFVNAEDVEKAVAAMDKCKDFIDRYIEEHEHNHDGDDDIEH